jgi:hypothetical protein
MMRNRRSRVAACLTLVCIGATSLAISVPGASSHSMTNCVAKSQAASVNTSTKQGTPVGGAINCTGGNYWQGNLDLRNRAGSQLSTVFIASYQSDTFSGNTAGCAGAIVHSHTYVNDNGAGSSDEGPENFGCQY